MDIRMVSRVKRNFGLRSKGGVRMSFTIYHLAACIPILICLSIMLGLFLGYRCGVNKNNKEVKFGSMKESGYHIEIKEVLKDE